MWLMLEIYKIDNIKRHNLRLTIISLNLVRLVIQIVIKNPLRTTILLLEIVLLLKKTVVITVSLLFKTVKLADNISNVKNLKTLNLVRIMYVIVVQHKQN